MYYYYYLNQKYKDEKVMKRNEEKFEKQNICFFNYIYNLFS